MKPVKLWCVVSMSGAIFAVYMTAAEARKHLWRSAGMGLRVRRLRPEEVAP